MALLTSFFVCSSLFIAFSSSVAVVLHGDRIAETGLKNAIESELDILNNTGQYKASLIITGQHYRLDQQREMILFRILREALNNSIKHCKAKIISVQLNYAAEKFSLHIKGDGNAFDKQMIGQTQTGVGLKSM